MNTKILEYMLAVAETRSITRAAERFYLSHPALSRHLRNIEAELGTPLFTRQPDGMHLTAAGILFMNDAQAILHIETELNKELAAMRHRQRNQLHIMLDDHFYNSFLRRAAPQFHAAYPEFTLEATRCNAVQARRALLDGGADLALFDSLAPQTAGLESLPLVSHEMLLAFPPSYTGPLDAGGLRGAIENGMFITLYPVGSTARTIQEQQLAACRIYPARILEGLARNNIDHIREGNTCGLLLDIFCTEEVRARVRVGQPFGTVHTVIAYAAGAALSAAAQELMQIILQQFA